jgi:hypothetical protein
VSADETKVALGNTGASFADKNAGTGKTVTLNGTSLSGAEAANYKLATTAVTTTADITPATLTYVATPLEIILGQPLDLTGQVTGFVGAESLASSTEGSASFQALGNTQVPGVLPVQGSGLTAANYVFVQAEGNARALTLKPGSPPVAVNNAAAGIGQDGSVSDTTLSSNSGFNSNVDDMFIFGAPASGKQGESVTSCSQLIGQSLFCVVDKGVRLPPVLTN